MVMQSVLAILRDEVRPMDVMEVHGDGVCRYALVRRVGWWLGGGSFVVDL